MAKGRVAPLEETVVLRIAMTGNGRVYSYTDGGNIYLVTKHVVTQPR